MNANRTNLARQAKTSQVRENNEYNLTVLDNSFGKTILEARKFLGLTQEQLADLAKISKPYIGTIENARRHTSSNAPPKPDRDKIIRLVKALNEKLPAERQIDLNAELNKFNYAPESDVKKPPQNVAEFVEALERLGVTEWDIPGEDLNKLPPEAFAQLIDVIETNIRVQLKKVA